MIPYDKSNLFATLRPGCVGRFFVNSPRPLDPKQFDLAISNLERQRQTLACKATIDLLMLAKQKLFGGKDGEADTSPESLR